ncbi:DEAD/DEAH box helicase [Paeniglutamicibacter cryotolerans]|uniref:Superfamily II DNA/RNA helicase n=1 Tax=Paeniglutamicibacter cryotolerans TaxID=670079 RepID=A0A839QDQ7_9MICC|nr:DEAD/DEAH box helicase [Paeniglutamicibacter cryotolerans]MBB2994279.1 superfamily II DNA/RNA helicase [Paeniglutamicibacter cryotolerans]
MSLSFTSLGVPSFLSDVLSAQGIDSAFPIQEATLPSTLAGGDVLGRGQTGSGKTIAFSLPVVARLAADPKSRKARTPRALIMAPTRELATQISKVVEPLAQAANLRTSVVFGGVSQVRQEKDLNAGVDILIACPGRLEDLLKQRIVDLSRVEVSVLDEADHMADLGFLPVVKRILDQAPRGIQHLLFSATLDNGVDKLVQRYLSNPTIHSVDAPTAAVNTMEHHVFLTSADDKKDLVRTLASGSGRRIMFMRTKHHAKKMTVWLSKSGIPAVDLHGNLSQNARDRNLAAFSSGEARVLVATDVAARGVHVDGVELVVHIDPPAEHKAYLHRSGRTARAGSDGTVVTLVTPDQQSDVKSMMKAAGIKVPFEKVSPNGAKVLDVVGERAELVAYVAPQERSQSAVRTKTLSDSDAAGGRGRRRGGRGAARAGAEPARGGERRDENRSERSGAPRGERRKDGRGEGRTENRGERRNDSRGDNRGERRNDNRGESRGENRDVARRGNGSGRGAAPARNSGGQRGADSRGGDQRQGTSSSSRPRTGGHTIADALGSAKAEAAAGASRGARGRGPRRATAPQSNQKNY